MILSARYTVSDNDNRFLMIVDVIHTTDGPVTNGIVTSKV